MVSEKYINAPDNYQLYSIEQGSGPTLVFIPGLVVTTTFFQKQMDVFSRAFRCISYDPRSQGKSSLDFQHNNNVQRGKDLKLILDAYDIDEACFIGWSDGYFAICSYAEQFGLSKIKAVVNLDRPVNGVIKKKGDYAFGSFPHQTLVYLSILHDYENFLGDFIRSFFDVRPDEQTLNTLINEALITPCTIASQLLADNLFRNYQQQTIQLAEAVPYLHFVAKERENMASQWCEKYIPSAELHVFGKHMMFWEYEKEFNAILSDFLQKYFS